MDAKTLEALKASIAKWERNAVAESPEDAHCYGSSCPLCAVFCDDDVERLCEGCPVYDAGFPGCSGSPWEAAATSHHEWKYRRAPRERFHDAAREEVAFLKSLLPEGEA